MENSKSTLWGAVALLVLVAAVLAVRATLVSERRECGERLERLVPRLEAYAVAHDGQLPATQEALNEAVGEAPLSTIRNLPYHMATEPLHWQQEPIQAYLWDPEPHPFINGIHVLATDGRVYLVERLEELPHVLRKETRLERVPPTAQ